MAFIRVKDKSTRHEFDVPETDPRIGEYFEPVKADRYPAVVRPRQPKYYKPTRATTKKEVADNG